MSIEEQVNNANDENQNITSEAKDEKPEQLEPEKVEDTGIVDKSLTKEDSTVSKTLLSTNTDNIKSESKVEDYDVSILQNASFSEQVLNNYLEKAKALKLNKEQAKEVFDVWHNLAIEDSKKIQLESAEAEKVLKEEWGRDFDFNLSKASYTAEKFGGKEFIDFLNSSGLGNNPQLIKTFHNISKNFIEDKFVGLNAEQPPPSMERWHGLPMLKFKM